MNQGTTIFAQILAFIDYESFRSCVRRYDGDLGIRQLSCWEQFLAMAFAQLTYRESLRDIVVSLNAHRTKLYHSGFRSVVKRSTLADANEKRDWRIYADFAQSLIETARPLYADTDLGLDLNHSVFALDATTIDLCLTLFPWAHFRRHKAGVKLHTMIDVQGAIPVFIDITDAKAGDAQVLDHIVFQPGSYVIMDRGFTDFLRLHRIHQSLSFFVIRAKVSSDRQIHWLAQRPIDSSNGQTDFPTLSRSPATHQLSLRRNGQAAHLSYQRFLLTASCCRCPLSTALANRTLLQMDQTTSPH